MKTKIPLFLIASFLTVITSCKKDDSSEINESNAVLEVLEVTDDVVQTLKNNSYNADNIEVVNFQLPDGTTESRFQIEDHIIFSAEEIKALPLTKESSETGKNYHTNNLVGPRKLKIIGYTNLRSNERTALKWAVDNYNRLNLGISFELTYGSAYSDKDIVVYRNSALSDDFGARSGYPSNRNPNKYISFNVKESATTNQIEHLLTHQIGHSIGMRHSDWENHESCSNGGNEGVGSVGANPIPGTPTGFDSTSLMNTCMNYSTSGELNTNDITALRYVYPSTPNEPNGLPNDVDSNYVVTFEDDFDQESGTLPDKNKWNSRLPWGPETIINSERQYYTDVLREDNKAPNPFNFDGDNLMITAGLNNSTQKQATGQDYYSGLLTGRESTPYRDGYIEARIKFEPGVAGFWGAFWLLHESYDYPEDTGANGKRRTEIDWEFVRGPGGVFLGGPYTTDKIPIAYHYDDGSWSISGSGFKGPNEAPGESEQCDGTAINSATGIGPVQQPGGGDLAGSFHRYGIWKTDEFIKWYLDGVLVASICDPDIVSQIDMYPIINIAVGGNFPGPPNSADYPTTMLVDYIRLWEPN